MAQALTDAPGERRTPPATGARRPRAVRPAPTEQPDPLSVAKEVVTLASDKGAADILLMDIRKQSIIADYFVICSGDNERQIRAISRGIRDGLDDQFRLGPLNRMNQQQEAAGWVVLDYGGVVVHVFSPQMREFYRLERLWSEAATLLRMQ
ncbi:MAG: ribosome silencing factor [Chloroflexota bacterium]